MIQSVIQSMPQRTIRCTVAIVVFAFVFAQHVHAQSTTSLDFRNGPGSDSWQIAQSFAPAKGKLIVVTAGAPQRWQTCRIESFTVDKLVCSRAIGGPRTYLPQQVAALIVPGDDALKLRLVLGFNGGLATAIWSTVVLAAICPPCAVATGIAALFFIGAAGAVLIGDDQPARLLYLAPGQQLTGKHRYVSS
jgi:hypothetical protein